MVRSYLEGPAEYKSLDQNGFAGPQSIHMKGCRQNEVSVAWSVYMIRVLAWHFGWKTFLTTCKLGSAISGQSSPHGSLIEHRFATEVSNSKEDKSFCYAFALPPWTCRYTMTIL